MVAATAQVRNDGRDLFWPQTLVRNTQYPVTLRVNMTQDRDGEIMHYTLKPFQSSYPGSMK